MKKIYLILFFIINYQFLITEGYSQQVQQEWVRYYPEQNIFNGGSSALVLDNIGNVYIAGAVNNVPPTGSGGFCTIKYSPSGTQQWVSNYFGNNSGGRGAFALAIDSFKNVYVTGDSYENGDYFDYCTIKYDSNGVQQWIRFYDDTLHGIDEAQKIGVDNAGNIYISGISQIISGNYSFTTIKYSTDGRQIWINAVNIGPGGPGADGVAGLVIDDNCNIYITGWGDGPRTIKYDSSGALQWNNLDFNGESHSIAMDKNNNIYIAGFTYTNEFHQCFLTIKYNSLGVLQWYRIFNADSMASASYYNAYSIAIDSLGYLFVSGYYTIGQNGRAFCLVKYSNDGNPLWISKDSSQIEGGTNYMVMDNKSNIYLTGSNYWSIFDYTFTPIILKYDSSGTQIWRFRDSTGCFPLDILGDNNSNIYTTGYRNARMCSVKYSQPIGIKKISNSVPQKFSLYQNYPNPFNPTTKIKFSIPRGQFPLNKGGGFGRGLFVKLTIYDLLGREVTTLVNESLQPGTYEVNWNATNFASGIYFYRLETGDFTQTKKMALLK